MFCLSLYFSEWHDISSLVVLQGWESLQRLCKSAGILWIPSTVDHTNTKEIPLRSQQVSSGHYKIAQMEANQKKSTDQGSEDDTMSSTFMIKCVLCKSDFDQTTCRTRFCEKCRSKEMRVTREAYHQERRIIRRSYRLWSASASHVKVKLRLLVEDDTARHVER